MLPNSRISEYLKVLLLALTVATVTLLNQRQVAVWQQVPASVPAQGSTKLSENEAPRKAVVYQKVCFEATPSFAVPVPPVALAPVFTWVAAMPVAALLTLPNLPESGLALAVAGLFGTAILARAP